MESYGYDQPPAYTSKDGGSGVQNPAYPSQQYCPDQVLTTYPPYPQTASSGQQIVVVSSQPPIIANYQPPPEEFITHIVTSCCVLWCCNPLFGLIAFVLAVIAQIIGADDRDGARRLGQASIGVSMAGIVVSVILLVVIICVAQSECSDGEC